MAQRREIIRTPDALDLGKVVSAPASPATRGAGLIFATGYVGFNPETGEPESDTIEDQTRRTLENLKTVLEAAGSSFDKVLRVHIFMSDLAEWRRMNKVYQAYFPADPPARRTVQAHLIPGYKVEIDCIALE